MSSLEIAGVVLGSFPILIASVEHWRDVANRGGYFWRVEREYVNCLKEIQSHKLLYERNMNELLSLILSNVGEVTKLLNDPGGKGWSDQSLQQGLARQLQESYGMYMDIIDEMNKSVQTLKKELILDRTAIQHQLHPVHLKQQLAQAPESISSTAMSSKEEWSYETFDIAISFRRSIRSKLLGRLKIGNERLENLLNRFPISLHAKSEAEEDVQMDLAIDHANRLLLCGTRLHGALYKERACTCMSHSVLLGLSHKTKTKLEFDVMFGLSSAYGGPGWRRASIRVAAAGSALSSEEALQNEGDVGSATWKDPNLPENAEIRSIARQQLVEIEDICKALSSESPDHMGFIAENRHRFLMHFASENEVIEEDSFVSLAELLEETGKVPLTRRKRYLLVFVLAEAYLHLATPWLNAPLRKENIVFFRNAQNPHDVSLEDPYLRHEMPRLKESAPRADTLDLGFLLLEIAFGRALDLATALKSVKFVDDECGYDCGHAIKWCLMNKTRDDDDWKLEFWNHVIVPLEKSLLLFKAFPIGHVVTPELSSTQLANKDAVLTWPDQVLKESLVLDVTHTDSGYASLDRAESSCRQTARAISAESFDIHHSEETAESDIQSVISDVSDIKSLTSVFTTAREHSGKAHIAQILAQDHILGPLCQEALNKMGRPRFANTVRRILKFYFKGLIREASTERERLCVSLLKSKRGRLRIGHMMAEIIETSGDLEADPEDVNTQLYRRQNLNSWLADLPGGEVTDDFQKLDMEIGDYLSSQSDSSDDESSEADLPHLTEIENFFCGSKPFQSMLNDFRTLPIPPAVRDIVLSTPRNRICISRQQDSSLMNKAKSFIEDYTQLEWDWWPLRPRLKRIQPGQARLFWNCSCGSLLWTDISDKVAGLISEKLPDIDQDALRYSRCRDRRSFTRPREWSGEKIRSMVLSLFGKRYTPSGSSSSTPAQQAANQGPSQNVPGGPTTPGQQQSQQTSGATTNQQSTSSLTVSTPLTKFWVLFGVQGPRPALEISHIEIQDQTNDSAFYRLLRKQYSQSRGRLCLWFSMWRIGYCEVVKFKRIAPKWVIMDRKDMPEKIEYIYTPRPPVAVNPPIPAHEFAMHLNACEQPCWWSAFHYCMPELDTSSCIATIPKKRDVHAFDAPSNDDKYVYAWGLEAKHVVSALYVVVYHVLIFLLPFGFWAWWMSKHPDDMQGASVPVTIVLGMLSLFWSTNGILTEGRHKIKDV
ncbi:hypothetical protein FB567DRAFT_603720 [Paraphoma chrysanthemicola]|uniref:DUF7580 domain-containing protein n=1 Tax=Paraphoma chrysanthemicola TaxID=798071 RepID=A0A8K0VXZ0_9PLEO|nr:hypothetical protein FB567DRAFT_603720 [Paraphoma chrysanthemicola]